MKIEIGKQYLFPTHIEENLGFDYVMSTCLEIDFERNRALFAYDNGLRRKWVPVDLVEEITWR